MNSRNYDFNHTDTNDATVPDVFNDIPDVDGNDDDDMMFELSDMPHIPTYYLELQSDNG